ncbi:WD40-repeat-containing domain protein [Whalleya microplaca]|nr:WD40-repeat-containing domain protein [Whalleya microplaca]
MIRIWDSWQEVSSDKSPRILEGHSGEVSSVAFSPERPRYLASGSDDGTSKIWALDKDEVLTLKSDKPVTSISFSPDGLRLASSTKGSAIDIWDAVQGGKLEVMRAYGYNIRSIAFSPTGAYLASASQGSSVHLWSTANGYITKNTSLKPLNVNEPISELIVAPDGQTIAAGHKYGKVTLWNMNDVDALPTVTQLGHEREILCLAFSPDGSSLASGSSDRTARVCDVATGEERVVFPTKDNWVRIVVWSPDGEYLAFGSSDNSIHIYKVDFQTKSCKEPQVVTHSDSRHVRALAFSPGERRLYLAVGGGDGKMSVWKKFEEDWELQYTINAHSNSVRSIVFTPDSRRIVSAAADRTLRIWDCEAKNFVGDTIHTRVVHTQMRFEKGWGTLEYVVTPHGAQPLDPSIKSVPDWCPYGEYEYERGDEREHWITWNDQKAIFLPGAFSPGATYFMDHKLIVGTKSGFVLIFRFSDKGVPRLY